VNRTHKVYFLTNLGLLNVLFIGGRMVYKPTVNAQLIMTSRSQVYVVTKFCTTAT